MVDDLFYPTLCWLCNVAMLILNKFEEFRTMSLNFATASVIELQTQLTGSVLTPNDADYEQVRRGWNLNMNHYPSLIVLAKNANDIVAGVRFASAAGIGVAVQNTGHGMHLAADDNMLIVTSQMNKVSIDPEARTARVEGGAVWQDVLDKSVPHGLAPLLGSSPHVGVVGYTLGGGVGWLARKYGFAGDSVRWIDIVTADGVLRRASADENSDLFWGLRGGGGSFGIVTAMGFSLYPVETVYGGNLFYTGELAQEALHFFRDWTQNHPEELTSSLAILKFPDFPQLPEALRGTKQVVVRAVYSGNPADGERYIQQWLDWNTPLNNTFRTMPFSEIATISNDPVAPAAAHGSSEMFTTLSDAALNTIFQYALDSGSPLVASEIRHLGGAMMRDGNNAISNRDARYYLQVGGPTPTPAIYAASKAYIEKYKSALQSYRHGGAYMNFLTGTEAPSNVRQAFPAATYDRLVTLKAKYDPHNLFRFSYQLVTK
jgi:FAD/FMN-containing dehydrogenase